MLLPARRVIRRLRAGGAIPRINRAHPLAAGLVGCYLPGLTAGINLAGYGGNLDRGAANTFGAGLDGPALISTASDSGMTGAAPPAFTNWNAFSAFYRADFLSAPSGNPFLIGVEPNNGGSSPFFFVGLETGFGSYLCRATWNAAGTATSSANTTPDLGGGTHSVAASFVVNGGVVLYSDGVQQDSTAWGTGAPTSTSPTISLNTTVAVTSKTPNARTAIALAYNRALSAVEMRALDLDPYAFLIWPEPTTGKVSAGGGSSTLVAATGTFSLTGEPAPLTPAITGTFGAYTLTGEPATGVGSGNQVLVAAFGAFTLVGEPAPLKPAIVAGAGAFTLTGEPATLSAALVGAAGVYTLTGEPVTGGFTGSQTLVAQVGVFTLTGEPIIGGASQILIAGTGIFSLAGELASLGVPAATGVFNLSGLRIWDSSDHFSTWAAGAKPLTRWTTKRDLN